MNSFIKNLRNITSEATKGFISIKSLVVRSKVLIFVDKPESDYLSHQLLWHYAQSHAIRIIQKMRLVSATYMDLSNSHLLRVQQYIDLGIFHN